MTEDELDAILNEYPEDEEDSFDLEGFEEAMAREEKENEEE